MIPRTVLLVILSYFFSFNVFAEIVFETNFANDAGYYDSGTGFIRHTNLPEGWDGIRTNQGTISGVAGAGVNGSVAMKFDWPGGGTALATSLFKHLTGDPNTGYDDLYIRYHVRLPNNFRVGKDPEALPYWKWGRLWQNTGLNGAGWTELRQDAYYAVWNFNGGIPIWGIRNGHTFGANSGANRELGAAGGPRYSNGYFVSGSNAPGFHAGLDGHFEAVGNGAWDFNETSRVLYDNSTQGWHTIEWHFKLSSSATSGDGVFQLWYDGEEQIPTTIGQGGGNTPTFNPPLAVTALPTSSNGGSGYNLFTLFDNISGWNRPWDDPGVEGGIYVNDVVISSTRIGHNYAVGDPLPNPTVPNPPNPVSAQ